jgi:hypothetical protein
MKFQEEVQEKFGDLRAGLEGKHNRATGCIKKLVLTQPDAPQRQSRRAVM